MPSVQPKVMSLHMFEQCRSAEVLIQAERLLLKLERQRKCK